MYMRKKFLHVIVRVISLSLVLVVTVCCKPSSLRPDDRTVFEQVLLAAPDNLVSWDISMIDNASVNWDSSVSPVPVESVAAEKLAFLVRQERRSNLLNKGGHDEAAREAYASYLTERVSSLQDFVLSDPNIPQKYYAPGFFDCGIADDISIFADCLLFGKPAGTDISEHFMVLNTDKRVRFSCLYPSLELVQVWTRPTPLPDYLKKGQIVPNGDFFVIAWESLPEDMPSVFHLTLRVPVSYESWLRFTWIEKSGEYERLPEKRNIEGTVEVRAGNIAQ